MPDVANQTTRGRAEFVRLVGDVFTGDQDAIQVAAQAVLGAGFRRLPDERVRAVLLRH
ncbi:hypothetical protein [Amycolatopsis magusensis]|uniref:hypothetical protein n=1 Tax=Amycolatopsis magusensis TaxID=882444 RepID=UPI0024A89612|nr:hypothetical protein [Amycolatopsis magusensis]MDI5979844.1 hypothetical protein [Amycolatopsis magusensis]